MHFHEMGLDDRILEAIANIGWKRPSTIQETAIPYFLNGKDILASARTGTGKTGAFLIPLIHQILEKKTFASEQVISALILTPRKELCKQIVDQLKLLTFYCQKEITSIDLSPQIPLEALRPILDDCPDIIVGTPLKVLSFINEGILVLKKTLQYLVVDEADLMLAFNHQKDITKLLRHLPILRQTFITSATLQENVKDLKSNLLHNPVIVKLQESVLPPNSQLQQYVIKIEDFEKIVLLLSAIKLSIFPPKLILFVNTVDKGYKIGMFLGLFHIKCSVLNSELPVNRRCLIVEGFNKQKGGILIASDEKTMVDPSSGKSSTGSKRKRDREGGVARGIDFQSVSYVINFDVPPDATAYVHRVGRTARNGKKGAALTMVSSHETKFFKEMEEDLREVLREEEIFKTFKFDFAKMDGFRYRACDAWNQCTGVAVKDFRRKELKLEILKSQKLKSFFEDHPRDLEAIKINIRGKTLSTQNHFKSMPEYIIPKELQASVQSEKNKKIRQQLKNQRRSGKMTSRDRYLKRSQDPLRSLKFSGFEK